MNFGSPTQTTAVNYNYSLGNDLLNFAKCEYWQSAPYYTAQAEDAKFKVQGDAYKNDL